MILYTLWSNIFNIRIIVIIIIDKKIKINSIYDTESKIIHFMGSNKHIITKIKCWPVFKQDPELGFYVINRYLQRRTTPLQLAARGGHVDVVQKISCWFSLSYLTLASVPSMMYLMVLKLKVQRIYFCYIIHPCAPPPPPETHHAPPVGCQGRACGCGAEAPREGRLAVCLRRHREERAGGRHIRGQEVRICQKSSITVMIVPLVLHCIVPLAFHCIVPLVFHCIAS